MIYVSFKNLLTKEWSEQLQGDLLRCNWMFHRTNNFIIQKKQPSESFLKITQNSQENTCTRISFLIRCTEDAIEIEFSSCLFLFSSLVVEYRVCSTSFHWHHQNGKKLYGIHRVSDTFRKRDLFKSFITFDSYLIFLPVSIP